jgi:hypothetical protein
MPAYDGTWFTPPASVARVLLRNPDTGAECVGVPLLIDSGADVTLLPAAVGPALGAVPDPAVRYELAGFDGSASYAEAIELEMLFCRRSFRGRFLLIDQDWGILGRNVLNNLRVRLDGPGLAWEEA